MDFTSSLGNLFFSALSRFSIILVCSPQAV
jgi:hypothetical protein